VTLDWNRIGSTSRELLVRPRDIFAALPSKPWSYLRQEQGEALEGWFTRRDDRDVVIKQNTGGGKTVVGLLIAQSTINEGVGKAVYLAPDTYLAARVREEAARLGLASADEPDDPRFLAERAILVTTFQKLVNGQSRFGVVGGRHPDRPRDRGRRRRPRRAGHHRRRLPAHHPGRPPHLQRAVRAVR
jgi:hypothetical protein